jgi:cytochrome c-type biogenesis protein CcmH/NrfG
MDRIAQLNEILAENPSDVFARYSLAMEYANSGQQETAVLEFRKLLAEHPGYVPAYQMLAQTLMRGGLNVEAHEVLCAGIETAIRAGNSHARSEMEAMLAEIG